jgi:hypothetical protein
MNRCGKPVISAFSLSYMCPRFRGEHAWCNVHTHQLLKQQLRSVRDVDLRNVGSRSAVFALEGSGLEIPMVELEYHTANMVIERD